MNFIKKIIKKKSSGNLIFIVITSVILGIFGGLLSQIFFGNQLLENYYQMPYIGELNLKNGIPSSSFVIRDARKVVVEQDDKIQEVADYVGDSLVGIFRKKDIKTEEQFSLDFSNLYKLDEERGQGIVITSDGWILTPAFSPLIRSESEILNDYVVITKDRKIYEIDQIIRNPSDKFGFIRAKNVKDLNVGKFKLNSAVFSGKQVLSLNWQGEIFMSRILNHDKNKKTVKSSDFSFINLFLDSVLPEKFKGSPITDLDGHIVGVVDNQGNIEHFDNYVSEANSLLKYGEIKKMKLGVNYIDLSSFLITDKNYQKGAYITKNEAGIAVEKNSPADLAGLKAGDIITVVDNIELGANISLNEAMRKYVEGDTIDLIYYRNGEKQQVRIKL